MTKIIVTGGAGFIGSAMIRFLCQTNSHTVPNLDYLTYAGHLSSVKSIAHQTNYMHHRLDIRDGNQLGDTLLDFRPDYVIHFAAESHVDRSIYRPSDFVSTNVIGTYELLMATTTYWSALTRSKRDRFRFLHVSTDEVYGSAAVEELFTEESPYRPNNPYSASKAGSDHLVRAWHNTYGLPTITTHCSNNYGPYQFPEKFIPLMILNALERKPLPIYGTGHNVRDWLHVDDHVQALWKVIRNAASGTTFNIGANQERTNRQVAETICTTLDELKPHSDGSYGDLIKFVDDRLGHDERYAIDASKIKRELAWEAQVNFDEGIKHTILWYIENSWWWNPIREASGKLRRLD